MRLSFPPFGSGRVSNGLERSAWRRCTPSFRHGWSDFEEIELPGLPGEGEPVDTKFGTLLVESAEKTPDGEKYDGKIVCRMP